MRQDHSFDPITVGQTPSGKVLGEDDAEEVVVRRCLKVNKIHWGILEHPQLTFSIVGAPRHALIQLRTHRHTTWDITSMRETGSEIVSAGVEAYRIMRKYDRFPHNLFPSRRCNELEPIVKKFFDFEFIIDRLKQGQEAGREIIISEFANQLVAYSTLVEDGGLKKELARGVIGDAVLSNAHVTLSLRALLHIASVRLGGDTQESAREIVGQMLEQAAFPHPQIVSWFNSKEPKKLTIAP